MDYQLAMERQSQATIEMPTVEQESPVIENEPLSAEQLVEAVEAREEAPEQPQVVEEKPIERNFRALREAKERAEYERDQLALQMKKWQQSSDPLNQQVQSQEEDVTLNPDDLVEWRHVESKIKKLESKLRQYEENTTAYTTESKLNAQFPDFSKVVNSNSIEMLKLQEPELAQALNATTDLYAKAVAAYKIIKKLGIHEEEDYNPNKEVIKNNTKKPRPLTSLSPQQGDSPLSKANAFANGLTDELKKQMYKEMIEARRQM